MYVNVSKGLMSMYPVILVIDADDVRAQRVARILTLADYRPVVVRQPYQAFERYIQQRFVPAAIVLGQPAIQSHFLFKRLLKHIIDDHKRSVPLVPLTGQVPNDTPLYADALTYPYHRTSKAALEFLSMIWKVVPSTRHPLRKPPQSLVMDTLPASGMLPKVSQELRSSNAHFRQVLKAAHNLIGSERWATLLNDVGLGQYGNIANWPLDNELRETSAEYLSLLNQAVVFSDPGRPAHQLRLWSNYATEISLERRTPSALTQHALKLLSQERVMSLTLNAFVNEMNAIRGEELHMWRQRLDGSYWIVNYSNLYAYGRLSTIKEPQCHVWVASIQGTLNFVNLGDVYEVNEKECSCQTLTGHCLFTVRQRQLSGT